MVGNSLFIFVVPQYLFRGKYLCRGIFIRYNSNLHLSRDRFLSNRRSSEFVLFPAIFLVAYSFFLCCTLAMVLFIWWNFFFFSRPVLNPFTTGNPFLGTKLLGFSIGRGSGALKGLRNPRPSKFHSFFVQYHSRGMPVPWLFSFSERSRGCSFWCSH